MKPIAIFILLIVVQYSKSDGELKLIATTVFDIAANFRILNYEISIVVYKSELGESIIEAKI